MFHTLDDIELRNVRSTLLDFAKTEKQSLADAWHNRQWPEGTWKRMKKHKKHLKKITIDDKESILKTFSAIEGFCRGSGDSSFCTSLIVQFLLCAPIKNKYFPDYKVKFSEVACFGLTEKQGGSTPFNMRTQLNVNKQKINGIKWHITNSPPADHILTFGKVSMILPNQ